MVLFSVKSAKWRQQAIVDGMEELTSIYLNILGVVVLAKPSDAFVVAQGPDPSEVHGVDVFPRLEDFEASLGVNGGGGESGEESETF